MIKKNIVDIENSLDVLKDCIDKKRCLPKNILDDKLKDITKSLNELKDASVKLGIPQPVSTPDIDSLKNLCEEYITLVASGDYYDDNDYEHFIYEKALEAIFGESVFDWINKQRD